MGDHDDHIHVGFRPLFGANRKLGRQALAVLKPGQWSDVCCGNGQTTLHDDADYLAIAISPADHGPGGKPCIFSELKCCM